MEIKRPTATPAVGRFAPSPTGELHFGSLLAAMASYCDIRHKGGRWLLRIDDIDGPRSVPGSEAAIQRALITYGMEWDGPVILQSSRQAHYRDALHNLVCKGLIFACSCSRKQLPAGKPYPGNCRSSTLAPAPDTRTYAVDDHALRCRLSDHLVLNDAVQGRQPIDLSAEVGDLVIWRRDGLVSYALACSIDDSDQVTQVVRGADLLHSTGGQIGLMNALDRPVPDYAHIPVAMDTNGDKLSKHSKAPPITTMPTLSTLLQAWRFLGQTDIQPDSVTEFWDHAIALWQINRVPGLASQRQ